MITIVIHGNERLSVHGEREYGAAVLIQGAARFTCPEIDRKHRQLRHRVDGKNLKSFVLKNFIFFNFYPRLFTTFL